MSRSCSISTKLMCAGSDVQQRDELAPLGRRQPGRRLVEQDQARRAGERHADLELALLAVREIRRRARRRCATGARARAGRSSPALEAWPGRGRQKLKRPLATPRTARNRLSRTVRSRNSSEDWYVRRRPLRMRSCGGSSVMSSPKKWIRPEVGGKSPVMALKSVVLPAPLEPRMAYFSPAADRQRHVVDGAQGAEGARHAAQHQRIVGGERRARRGQAAPGLPAAGAAGSG